MLRGALIGCGYFAAFHASAWSEIDGVELVAACDVDAARASRMASLRARSGATVVVDLSYASRLENETFPQTLVHLEGGGGAAVLDAGYTLTVTCGEETEHAITPPPDHPWGRPPSEAVHDSVLNIQRHWVECLREEREPETSGRDNLRTLELMFGAYVSASTGQPISIKR